MALCLVQDTVKTERGKIVGFAKQEVKEAKTTWEAQGMLGHPTDHEFLGMVHSNMIVNCDVTESVIINAHIIFDPNLIG